MNFKFVKIILWFLLITMTSVLGYFLLLYGANLSEVTKEKNIYLFIGEVLMWPLALLDWMQSYLYPDRKSLEFYSSILCQYISYFLMFYLFDFMYKKLRK